MLKFIQFWEKLSLKRFRKQRLASIFLLSLTISVWIGLILPIYPQSPQQTEREALIEDIKEFAEYHVNNDQGMDVSLVIDAYEDNAVGLTVPEIAKIYKDEYTRLEKEQRKDSSQFEIILRRVSDVPDELGWISALV